MSRCLQGPFRYLFSEEGDVYLSPQVLLVEIPFHVDQYELGPYVDPQIDIDNPEHVVSKTLINVLDLLAERDALVAERDALLAVVKRLQGWGRRAFRPWAGKSLDAIIHDAGVAIAKMKGGEG